MELTAYIGLDEAGRGCVIGPLFLATVALDSLSLERLREVGVKNSKKLTRKKREELEKLIKSKALAFNIEAVNPREIDANNLNNVELRALHTALTKVVEKLHYKGFEIVRAVVDLFGREDELKNLISSMCPKAEVVLKYKADESFIECSAASILAKVARDRYIEKLKKKYGDFASGYPSDRKTVNWLSSYLRKQGSLPNIVRYRWKTVKKIINLQYY